MNILLYLILVLGVLSEELLISKTYEAEDVGLDLPEHPQCKAWNLWKRTREETIDLSTDDIDLLASRRQLVRINDKKAAKQYIIPEELLTNYTSISIDFRSICELNIRILTIQTERAATKYGLDVEVLCQQNTSTPDLSEVSIFDGEYIDPLPAKYRIVKRNLLSGQNETEVIWINSTSDISDRTKGLDLRVFDKHQSVIIYPTGVCGTQSEVDGVENLQYYQEKYGHLSFDISVLGEKIETLMAAQQDIDRLDNIMEKFEAFNKNKDRPFPSSQIIPWLKKVKYDPRSPPVLFQDDRVIVKMGLHIQSMSNFELSTMDFDMDTWLRMCWLDQRLRHSFSRPVLINDYTTLRKIWRPDPIFKNAKSAAFHKVSYLNFYMYIFPEGEVFMDIRVFLKPTTAQIVLCKYPHDSPACSLRISSMGFTHDVVQFEWFSRDSDAIRLNSNMQIPELVIEDYRPLVCDGSRKSGNYSCLEVLFVMSREIGYHVAHTYIPTAICVIFSMVSVWLPEEFVEGRIFVSLTVFLTLSAESNSAKEELPKVSYTKAIDIWFGFTSIFVFFTMIQALFVICLEHESRKLKQLTPITKADVTRPFVGRSSWIGWVFRRTKMRQKKKKAESHIDDYSTHQIAKMLLRSRYYHKLGRKLDAFFKVMYPVIFLIFLIIYGFVITQGDEKKCLPDNLV